MAYIYTIPCCFTMKSQCFKTYFSVIFQLQVTLWAVVQIENSSFKGWITNVFLDPQRDKEQYDQVISEDSDCLSLAVKAETPAGQHAGLQCCIYSFGYSGWWKDLIAWCFLLDLHCDLVVYDGFTCWRWKIRLLSTACWQTTVDAEPLPW